MRYEGSAVLSGGLNTHVITPNQSFGQLLMRGLPSKHVDPIINAWRRANMMSLIKGASKVWAARQLSVAHAHGALYLTIVKPVLYDAHYFDLLKRYADIRHELMGVNFVNWANQQGVAFRYLPLGLAGLRVVTTVGVGYIVDAFQNTTELENMKFHGLGTGSTAEDVSDTALVTELTTEYTGNVRATGTTTEGASANIFRTVATNTLDGTPGAALREHGVFSASSAGVLLDRTVYAAITLSSGDGLQTTYDLTLTPGS